MKPTPKPHFSLCALFGAAALLLNSFAAFADTPSASKDWRGFRGNGASGVSDGKILPIRWNIEKKENLLWTTPIPGLGHSAPVIVGDLLFVTTAISSKPKAQLKVGLYGDIDSVEDNSPQKFEVYCLSKSTGKIIWKKTAITTPPQVKRHPKSSYASPTVGTDGKVVVASFGSEGLYCYDFQGNLLWKRDLGLLDSGYYQVPDAQWGFASSPVISDGRVIVQCDVQKNSFLAALDLKTGKDVWRTPRKDVPTWGTPLIVEAGGKKQIVVNGWKHIGGYNFADGKEIWKLTGGGDIPVPSPVYGQGLIFITNAHGRMSPIYAVKPDAQGDISLAGEAAENAGVAWSYRRDGSYMQTPLVYGDYLYVCRDNGVLGCYEAKTGKRVYTQRLGDGASGFSASMVGGDGKLYVTSEEGEIYVLKAGSEFSLLAKNEMGAICMATPAISDGKLYYRTQSAVMAVGGK